MPTETRTFRVPVSNDAGDLLNRFASLYADDIVGLPDQTLGKSPEDLVETEEGSKKVKDCVYVDGMWYLKSSPDLALCSFTNRYFRNKYALHFIKDFDDNGLPMRDNYAKADSNWITHSYLVRNFNDCFVTIESLDGNRYTVLYSALPKEHYTEDLNTGIYVHNKIAKVRPKGDKVCFRKANNVFKDKKNLKKAYAMGIISPTYIKTEGKKYSFGVEFETISGRLPEHADIHLNYEAMRDGSLKHEDDGKEYGGEYVTGVLRGDTGLMQLNKMCNYLTKYCKVNKKCGMHIHIGDLVLNSENIVHFYKLASMLEKEIFLMLPLSRRKNEYCRELKKFKFNFTEDSYNNPLEYKNLIEEYYLQIFEYISHVKSTPDDSANKKTQHPMGNKCGYRHETARYCWLNFVPAIFDTRGNGVRTLEIRNHPGTTNFRKVKNYLLIFMAMAWFVENRKREIGLASSLTLADVIIEAFPKNHKSILEYIDIRKSKFNNTGEEAKQVELQDYEETLDKEKLTILEL